MGSSPTPLRSIVALVSLAGMVSGCGGPSLLLQDEALHALMRAPDRAHRTVFHHTSYRFTPDKRLIETSHEVILVGRETTDLADYVVFIDSPTRRLVGAECRVVSADGRSTTYGLEDVKKVSLSGRRSINTGSASVVLFDRRPGPGDLVEHVSVLEHPLPFFEFETKLSRLTSAADSATCSIILSPPESLVHRVHPSDVRISVSDSGDERRYTFTWPPFDPEEFSRRREGEDRQPPRLLAAPASRTLRSLGDQYLALVEPKLQPGPELVDLARRITDTVSSARGKMDAIFDFCQRSIRYDQVYLEHGEVIPNLVDVVLSRRFGDCKDYAALMYAMATSVGLKPHLALCYRGREVVVDEDVPVIQANHLILHWDEDGTDRWYDGTNRVGLPGLTTIDLTNARALVLERGRSRYVTISESPDNRAIISGTLERDGLHGVRGTLEIELRSQYSIDLAWLSYHTNADRLAEELSVMLREWLNEDLVVEDITWSTGPGSFRIVARVHIANCITAMEGRSFIRAAGLFPRILPQTPTGDRARRQLYLPNYNRVTIDLSVRPSVDGPDAASEPTSVRAHFDLPPGPFTDGSRPDFFAKLDAALGDLRRPVLFPGGTSP